MEKQSQDICKQIDAKIDDLMVLLQGIEQDIPTLEEFVKQRINDLISKQAANEDNIMKHQGYNNRIEHKIDLLKKTLDEEIGGLRKQFQSPQETGIEAAINRVRQNQIEGDQRAEFLKTYIEKLETKIERDQCDMENKSQIIMEEL